MVELVIGNSYSQVKGITAEQFRALRKLLSYEANAQAVYFSGGYSRPKYLIDKQGYFPTGLLKLVLRNFQDLGVTCIRTDDRKRPQAPLNSFKLKSGPTPYPDQLEAADKAIKAGRGGIQMATGSGKSLVIALIASRLQVRTLVVVPTLELKKQLTASLNGYFGIRLQKNIVVENVDSKALQTLKDFDCLIIDEAHHAAAKTYQELNKKVWNNIYYRFFLTATFYRNQKNEQLLFEGIAGQLIHSLSIKEAIAKKYICSIEAYYIDLPKIPCEGHTWAQVYSELVTKRQDRNEIIAQLLIDLEAAGKSTLCLVKEIAHGNAISALSGTDFANGQDETTRHYIAQFNNRRIKSLIGTTGILGEGIDSRPAEFVIIAGLGKAKSAFLQQIGRAVRNYPGKESAKIILIRDPSHRFTLRHFNEQKKILFDELGIKPVKLNI